MLTILQIRSVSSAWTIDGRGRRLLQVPLRSTFFLYVINFSLVFGCSFVIPYDSDCLLEIEESVEALIG